jgi:cation transport ATPase
MPRSVASRHELSTDITPLQEKEAKRREVESTENQGPVLASPISAVEIDMSDLENGPLQAEHVVLSVQGMTCTGCEKKLHRGLRTIQGTSNIKTSLLLARAEFDLQGASTVTDIAGIAERLTGFTCTKLPRSGQTLDLIVNILAADIVAQEWPLGVCDLVALNAHTIRVTYQPKLVGARDLLDNPFFHAPELAPDVYRPINASGRVHLRSMLLKTVLCILLTVPVLVLAWAPLPKHKVTYGAFSLVLATIIQVYIAGPWFISAFNALFFSHLIEMNLLVVLSSTTAYVYSVIAYAFLVAQKPLSTGDFFQTSTLLITLIMVGHLVSGFARQQAIDSISVESLQPSSAILTDLETNQDRKIDARLLQYQDTFKALPDTSIVTDGTVVFGTSEVDESMITGEATPVVKRPGSTVLAGSINHSGVLTIRLSRLPANNIITSIGLMVDVAKSSKTKVQKIADRVASFFVPALIIVTILVFIIWVAVAKAISHSDTTSACITAMTYAIAVIVVSRPCAICLAVPMVVIIAGAVAAKHGIIFKSAGAIEIAQKTSHVIFDKTGTLTTGVLAVEVEIHLSRQDELSAMVLSLTSQSKHPVSIAIAAHLQASGIQPAKLENATSTAGSGIEGSRNGKVMRVGNP